MAKKISIMGYHQGKLPPAIKKLC